MHSKNYKISSGKILLTREQSSHTAAFSLVYGSLNEMENHLDTLHPTEKSTYNKHKFEARKKTFLLGRFASREALALMVPREKLSTLFIGNGVLSFPIVEGEYAGLTISITHCDDIGMAIVHPQAHPLAIDLERADPKRIKTFEEYLTPKEQNLIRQAGLPKIIGYSMAWTIKESLSKVLRTGLTLDFKFIELDTILRKENYYESTFAKFGQYKTISYSIGEYVCSIILPKFTTPDLKDFEMVLNEIESITGPN